MKEINTRLGPFYYREEFNDFEIIEEMRVYDKINFKDRVVLDLGSNIGAFARHVILHGAKRVVSFEPEPDNLVVNRANLVPGITLHPFAVVGGDFAGTRESFLYKNEGRNRGSHTIREKRGRVRIPIQAISIESVWEMDTFEAIKCDVEGAEYEIFADTRIPDSVKSIGFEFHFLRKEDQERARCIDAKLIADGFVRQNQIRFENAIFQKMAFYAR